MSLLYFQFLLPQDSKELLRIEFVDDTQTCVDIVEEDLVKISYGKGC